MWSVLYVGDTTKQLPETYIRYRQAQMYGIPTEDLEHYSAEIVERDWFYFNEEHAIQKALSEKRKKKKGMNATTTDLNSFAAKNEKME